MNIIVYNPTTKHLRVSLWHGVRVCSECYVHLNNGIYYYNHGICPFCGHNSNGTICDSFDAIYRKVFTYIPQWWQIWKEREYFIEAKDEDSYKAIKNMFN